MANPIVPSQHQPPLPLDKVVLPVGADLKLTLKSQGPVDDLPGGLILVRRADREAAMLERVRESVVDLREQVLLAGRRSARAGSRNRLRRDGASSIGAAAEECQAAGKTQRAKATANRVLGEHGEIQRAGWPNSFGRDWQLANIPRG